MKKYIRAIKAISFCLTTVLLATTLLGDTANAQSLPYMTYNYDYREYVHYTPAAYLPDNTIRGEYLTYEGSPLGKFLSPQDICKDSSGNVYIADTGNNRIVVLDSAMKKVINVISSFEHNGKVDTFNQPYGLYISKKSQLYIADSQNKRVVVLDADGAFVKIVANPTSESLEDDYVFTPLKVTVDYADRIYVIGQNMFEGIMVFENNGNFSNFFGTIKVEVSLWDKFWKRMATKEERANQQLFIPTEFTGIDIDKDGFVYASNIDPKGKQGVRRLNPKGEDVIKKGENEMIGGEAWIGGNTEYSGPSQFTDVVYRDNGIYSCLDRRRGRIFTYDHEGNLLYIFGGLGTQEGNFYMPVAIEDMGDRLIVLDATRAELQTFSVSEYGRLINEAVALRYDGDETLAVELWERVLELDENNELANTGIGKAYLTAGDYKQAMKYLELGMKRDYYSIAFRRYRNSFLTANANYLLTGVIVLIIIWQFWKRRSKSKQKNQGKGGLLNG